MMLNFQFNCFFHFISNKYDRLDFYSFVTTHFRSHKDKNSVQKQSSNARYGSGVFLFVLFTLQYYHTNDLCYTHRLI